MAKERALDIFNVLSAIDRKQYDIWETLTDDQRKEFSPLVVMRWMAGCDDQYQLIMLNEVVNQTVFQLGGEQYKEFMSRLLVTCSSGRSKRYKWVNYKLTSEKRSKIAVGLIAEHYNLSLTEAEDTLPLFSKEDLLSLAEGYGWQKEELKALQKELS